MAKSYRVAVTGSSGSGTSTLGNQLLGRPIFPVSGGLRQCTTTLRQARATRGGVELEVIDVPDFINLNTLPGLEMQRIESPDAVLLTLRRDFKFVREDYDQMHALLKMIPGGSADTVILVFTRADDLSPSNFDEFLQNAGPYLKDLYEEADGRYVLFSTDKDSESLVSDLADVIDSMKRSAASRRRLQCVPYAWVLFWAAAWCVSFKRETIIGDVSVPQSNVFYLTAATGPCLILYRKPLRLALRKYARQLKTTLYSFVLSRFGSRNK